MIKAFITPKKKAVVAWVLGLFSVFAICISVYAAAGRCVPCRANHYCPLGGIPYLCPADKPVRSGTGHDAQSDCMSCATRNGQGQPFFGGYQLGEGYECVSCVENDLTKPFWNGSECVACATADASKPVWNNGACEACPSDTTWDSTEGACVANAEPEAECAFTIPHNGGTLCLVEISYDYDDYNSPKSASEETPEFLAKYGINNASTIYPDHWAGAIKYCKDKGLHLASLSELLSIFNYLYNDNATDVFYNYPARDNAVAQSNLAKFLCNNYGEEPCYLVMAVRDERSSEAAYLRYVELEEGYSGIIDTVRVDGGRAICIK